MLSVFLWRYKMASVQKYIFFCLVQNVFFFISPYLSDDKNEDRCAKVA